MNILKTAKKYKLDYTRYADDLTFSTNDKYFSVSKENFMQDITNVIEQSGFRINEKKTRLSYKDSRQEVTGLIVNEKINVDSRYYRKTRAMANHLYLKGNFDIDGREGTLAQLEGRFSYINQGERYNNRIIGVKNQNAWGLSAREEQYRRFLFYKYFLANEKPLIITEGKRCLY